MLVVAMSTRGVSCQFPCKTLVDSTTQVNEKMLEANYSCFGSGVIFNGVEEQNLPTIVPNQRPPLMDTIKYGGIANDKFTCTKNQVKSIGVNTSKKRITGKILLPSRIKPRIVRNIRVHAFRGIVKKGNKWHHIPSSKFRDKDLKPDLVRLFGRLEDIPLPSNRDDICDKGTSEFKDWATRILHEWLF